MKPEGHEVKDEEIAEEIRDDARRGPFRFTDVGIPAGSEIEYIEDAAVKATVVDDRHIEYNGETTSLSALAKKLKGFTHTIPRRARCGSATKGERLSDLRNRLGK